MLFVLLFCALSLSYALIRQLAGRRRIYLPDAIILSTASHYLGAMILYGELGSEGSSFILSAAALAYLGTVVTAIWVLSWPSTAAVMPPTNYFHNKTPFKIAITLTALANIYIIYALLRNPAIFALFLASFSADSSSLLDVRKAITASTEGYLNPGLIKLVRDQIGPIAIAGFILCYDRAFRSPVLWISILATLAAMLIGGQRFPIVMLLIAISSAIATRRVIKGRAFKFRIGGALTTFTAVFTSFFIMSSLLGRSDTEANGLGNLVGSISSMMDRSFTTLPREAEHTYIFWSNIGPTWGNSWLADLSILLPGKNESFSNLLHELTGGSSQGNAVLFFALDSWLAFGWGGIIFSAVIAVTGLAIIDSVLWKKRSPRNDAARIVVFLNVPLMYSPYLFLLYGGIVVLPIVAWTLFTSAYRSPHFKSLYIR